MEKQITFQPREHVKKRFFISSNSPQRAPVILSNLELTMFISSIKLLQKMRFFLSKHMSLSWYQKSLELEQELKDFLKKTGG